MEGCPPLLGSLPPIIPLIHTLHLCAAPDIRSSEKVEEEQKPNSYTQASLLEAGARRRPTICFISTTSSVSLSLPEVEAVLFPSCLVSTRPPVPPLPSQAFPSFLTHFEQNSRAIRPRRGREKAEETESTCLARPRDSLVRPVIPLALRPRRRPQYGDTVLQVPTLILFSFRL